jgi:hypothetical protein
MGRMEALFSTSAYEYEHVRMSAHRRRLFLAVAGELEGWQAVMARHKALPDGMAC